MLKIFFILSILLLTTGCEEIINTGDTESFDKYPTQTGREWEYRTELKMEFYDNFGRIDSISNVFSENSIVRVITENDSVGAYTGLVLFETFDINSPQSINKIWYLNSDSGLFAFAYSSSGASQFVYPKQIELKPKHQTDFIKSIRMFPGFADGIDEALTISDTVLYYSIPRQVLKYPLNIGVKWTELTFPFFRERFIQKQQIVNTNGNNYNCFKLESNMSLHNIQLIDYINLDAGLVKREIISDSVMLTSVTNPDSGSYIKATTISKLVREKR